MTPLLHLFRNGDYVDVDPESRRGRPDSEGGKAFIDRVTPTLDVRYVLTGLVSPSVAPGRIHDAGGVGGATTGRRRRSDGGLTPSLLDYRYPEFRRLENQLIAESSRTTTNTRNTSRRGVNCSINNIVDTRLLLSLSISKKKEDVVDKIDRMNKTNQTGWLRKIEDLNKQLTTTKNTHLNGEEKNLVLKLVLSLKILCHRAVNKVAYAWGINRCTVHRLIEKETLDGGDLKRKERSDKGLTVFNSERRRQSTFTTFAVFKKVKRMENRHEKLSNADIYSAWMSLSDAEMHRYEELSEQQKARCSLLLVEIGQILRQTQGRLTWQQLASSLCGTGVPIVSHMSLARTIMKLPDSAYTTTRIFPLLNVATKNKRLEWSMNFWVFWNTAKLLTNKVKVLLVHMDEKWFYSVVVRKKNKYVPFLGMQSKVSNVVQHKSHIHKEMYICTTGYLPHDNDMTKGGLSYKVSMERVGKMLPAKRDSYRRVYNDDNTFSYPHIPENLIRRKGELYFQSMDVNATREGTVSAPKYSLLKFFNEKEIPRLEQLTETLKQKYNQPVVVRYQMDSAGPHTDTLLLEHLNDKFLERGWMLVHQPPQSPLTNVKDTCIFPSLSKTVSWNQSNLYNNKVLDGEELNTCVQLAFENLPLDTIARSYLGHHQMVNAIVEDNGGDNHMRSSSGLHCGVRRQSLVLYENDKPCGIYVAEQPTGLTVDEQTRSWKYTVPDVSTRDICALNQSELYFLETYLPVDSDLWESVATFNLLNEEER